MTRFLCRRSLLSALALTLGLALLGAAPAQAALSAKDQAEVRQVERYLDGMRSLKAEFIQVAPDGALSTGELFLRRPGMARFQYAPPSPILLVADGVWMVYQDRKLGQTTRLPLGGSPLAILLSDKIAIGPGSDVAIKAIHRGPGTLNLTLYQRDKPKQGTLTLIFSTPPLQLRQWVLTDAEGRQTTITLNRTDTNVSLPTRLFIVQDLPPPGERLPNSMQ